LGAKFTELIIDAADPDALATFWKAVLDVPRLRAEYGAVEIGDREGPGPTLVFVPVTDAKLLKNRLHIDVNPVG
jgi:Glyoxalase-like domain